MYIKSERVIKLKNLAEMMQVQLGGGLVKGQSHRVNDLMDSFISAQDVRQSSKDLYRRTLRQFFKWIDRKGYSLAQVSRHHVIEYKADLLSSGMSSLTVSSYITSVRRFYEWSESLKYYPNVAKGIRSPQRKQQFRKQPLTINQSQALLVHCSELTRRDYAIVNLLLRTGLRTVEVIRADIGDIVYKGGKRVLLVHGKGRDEKDNFVELTDKAFKPIASYLETRGRVGDKEPLFTSESRNRKGQRLTTRTVSFIAKSGLKGIGLNEKAFTAHSLRHTAGVNVLRAGGSFREVQQTLRHINPSTTQIYTATLDEEVRLKRSGESMIDSLF